MSSQDTYEETCISCGDGLRAPDNWSVNDVASGQMYCIKPECQAAKPIMMNSKDIGRKQKKREGDRGLSPQLRTKNQYVRYAPNPNKVAEFAAMIADPRMLNERGWPKYSIIMKEHGINAFKKAYSAIVMAAAQYPNEVDVKGCPSIQSVNAVRNYLKRLTKRYKGNLEIYSEKGVDEDTNRREWRWFLLKDPEDLKKQVGEMYNIARNIELAAKNREANFANKTYDQRMEKVSLLDKFFDLEP